MKQITTKEIEQVLGAVYLTNISAQQFDVLKQFFQKLPDVKKSEPEVSEKKES